MWRFAEPGWLGLLPVVLVCAFLATRRRFQRGHSLPLPTLRFMRQGGSSWRTLARPLTLGMRLLILALVLVALARPQSGRAWTETTEKGVDIVLLLDVSGSMQAQDFYPKKRIDAAKEVLEEFVRHQQGNRLGLVVFAGRSFTQCPLTTDYSLIIDLLHEVDSRSVQVDGTAIGDAVTNGLYRLKDKNRKGRVIVLLTDGENNTGRIDPTNAAQMARALGVKIYTVGMGRPGRTLVPIFNPVTGQREYVEDSGVDEPSLKHIARITGGHYFRGSDEAGLMQIYDHIAGLEKAEFVVRRSVRYQEQMALLVWPALLVLSLEFLLAHSRWYTVGA